jgi:ABC-2 type transport system ATP-binding protein
MEQTALQVRDVVQRFGRATALNGVTLTLQPGVTALIGVNGAGKTTLMTAVAGARRPTSGQVSIDGLNPYRWRERREALTRVACMPQTARFPGGMTALEVVEYLAWMRGLSRSRSRVKAREALAKVMLADRANTKVKRLSGGMVRRLTLAQAIASEPSLLLLDEPSTGLDPEQRRTMVRLITKLDTELATTVLLSSHVMEDVTDVAERVLVLDEGQLVFDGTVRELQNEAPAGTPEARAPEAGFLAVVSSSRFQAT